MVKNSQHVVPKDGGWAVRRQGAVKFTKVFGTQNEAVQFARNVARKQSGELFIHKADGTIRDRKSYCNDPCPPQDKR